MSAADHKVNWFFVLRSHSKATAKNKLIKVMSRRIITRKQAEDWMDFCKSVEKNKSHEFTIIEVPNDQWIFFA